MESHLSPYTTPEGTPSSEVLYIETTDREISDHK